MDIVISRPPARYYLYTHTHNPNPNFFFFSRRVIVRLPGQHWRKDIVISRPPAEIKEFFFSPPPSAGGRQTPRSALAEGYRNIPAPRRNKRVFFFFFFFFGRRVVVRLPGQHWRKDIVISRPPAEYSLYTHTHNPNPITNMSCYISTDF